MKRLNPYLCARPCPLCAEESLEVAGNCHPRHMIASTCKRDRQNSAYRCEYKSKISSVILEIFVFVILSKDVFHIKNKNIYLLQNE